MSSLKNYLLIISTVFIAVVSCEPPKEYAIEGQVQNPVLGEQISLWELRVGSASKIDSIVLNDDGLFHFNPKPSTRTFYRITREDNQGVLISIDSTSKVNLNINGDNFSSDYEVKGSEESIVLKELGAVLEKGFRLRDSLNQEYQANINNMNEALLQTFQSRMQSIDDEVKSDMKSFINKYPSSIATLVAIDNLDMDENLELFKKVDENVGERYPDSPYFRAFHEKFEYNSKLTRGNVVPDISLPDPDGNVVSLSSLRGKVVLIDFWASWCKPCRAENPNVVRLYKKYKDQNFEIFGVSLDRNREAWLNAIQADGLEWMHVSDLMLWQSAVVKLYNIQGIPLTILINEKGEIIAKNLRGERLENKLEELFGES